MDLSPKVEEFTDIDDWNAIQEAYQAFTRVPIAPNNEILDLARIAVTKFETLFLEGKLNQKLALKSATPKAREALEIVLGGDWSSAIDMNPRDLPNIECFSKSNGTSIRGACEERRGICLWV